MWRTRRLRRARAEARDAARRRAARTRDPQDAVVAAETARLFTRGEDASRAPERDDDAHGISDGFSLEQPLVASLEDLPAEWRAVADALYLLASLVELGVAPKTRDAYPPPRIERTERRSHSASHSASHKNSASPRFRATSDGHWADVPFADPSGTSVPTHPRARRASKMGGGGGVRRRRDGIARRASRRRRPRAARPRRGVFFF